MPSKSDVQQVLDGLHESLVGLIQRLEAASTALDTVDENDLQSFVDKHARTFREAYECQMQLWQRIASVRGHQGVSLSITPCAQAKAELDTLDTQTVEASSSKKPSSLKERYNNTPVFNVVGTFHTHPCTVRLAAMGATPALGNGMPLPKTSGQQRNNLHVNASPISREMFLSKHGVDLRTPGGAATPAASPAPWMVREDCAVRA